MQRCTMNQIKLIYWTSRINSLMSKERKITPRNRNRTTPWQLIKDKEGSARRIGNTIASDWVASSSSPKRKNWKSTIIRMQSAKKFLIRARRRRALSELKRLSRKRTSSSNMLQRKIQIHRVHSALKKPSLNSNSLRLQFKRVKRHSRRPTKMPCRRQSNRPYRRPTKMQLKNLRL